LSGGHSPRSVFSETNGPSSNALKGRPFCKYEKTPALSRRRMQYNIGDEPLAESPNMLKKVLKPEDDQKLTRDMTDLYNRLLPTPESERRRHLLVEKLEKILHKEWPGNEFNVHVFGSSGNLLCTSESDGKHYHLEDFGKI
jgi:DNA polymerase sigma